MKTVKLLALLIMLLPVTVNAGHPKKAKPTETECLAKILFAESEDQSIEGIVAVGEATINRSKRLNTGICKLRGVARKELTESMGHYWLTVARAAINDTHRRVVGNADSWNRGKRPAHKGKVTRVAGKHVFYNMAGTMVNRGPNYTKTKGHKKHKATQQILLARK